MTADERGRERHYSLERSGLVPVSAWLAGFDLAPRFDESALNGLELEVRRTVRDRSMSKTTSTKETA